MVDVVAIIGLTKLCYTFLITKQENDEIALNQIVVKGRIKVMRLVDYTILFKPVAR